MREFIKLTVGLALSSVMAFSASAEIIDSDWLTEGDGLTFTDTSQDIQFLDLSETNNMSVVEVKSLLDSTYSGWAFATEEQVVTMLTNLLADTEVQYIESEGRTTADVVISSMESILDTVGGVENNAYIVYGFIDGSDVSMYGLYVNDALSYTYYNYTFAAYSDTYTSELTSLWLVRDAQDILSLEEITVEEPAIEEPSIEATSTGETIDVPTPLAFSSLALLGLGLTRRKKTA